MQGTAVYFLRRAVSVMAFVLALIVLTGTHVKIREVAMEISDSASESEFCDETPLRIASAEVRR